MARMLDISDNGEILPEKVRVLTKFNVRFPTEKEQAEGMTEVPREMRRKKLKSGN